MRGDMSRQVALGGMMCRDASRSERAVCGSETQPDLAIRRYVAIRGAMSRYVAMSRAVCHLRV